ncbi:MAG: hypothetical protein WD992_03530 [Candidatus Levyibacteriota bacterium]
MVRRKSRLSRRTERKTKQNFILSLLGIIIVVFVVLKLGIPLLVNFSLFISNQKDNATAQEANDPSFIAPPILNPLPVATNSAQIAVSGIGNPDQTVRIYVNDELADEVSTKKDGSFSLVQAIKKGSNSIKAKSEAKGKMSGFSNTITVSYIDTKPTLELTSPSDGQTFGKDQNMAPVTGRTSAGARITVNGFWAIVDDNHNFSYNFSLQSGDNHIKVVATDEAGNTTEKEVRVTYNP